MFGLVPRLAGPLALLAGLACKDAAHPHAHRGPPAGQPAADGLARVAAIHGAAGPFAVAGYRMGQRALQVLGLPAGSFDLEVVHASPAEVQWSCIADGAQAATGASAGKLNLRLTEAPRAHMKTEFRRRSTGKTVTFRLTPRFEQRYLDLPPARLAAAGVEIMRLSDDDIFTVDLPRD